MKTKKLYQALSPYILKTSHLSQNDCKGLSHDSRKVSPNDLFIAIKGSASDGHQYIENAIQSGACSILLSDPKLFSLLSSKYPTIDFLLYFLQNSYQILGLTAELFADSPAKKLRLIGVTGTNGKTTTASIINYLIRTAGEKTALIGTNAYDLDGEILEATHTTPDPIQLQNIFIRCLEKEITTVVMEVSSHSAHQHRMGSAKFESLIFTNLTGEHLDYHKNMQNYFDAKKSLFEESLSHKGLAIINTDDEWGQRLFKQFPTHQAYGFNSNISDFKTTPDGSVFKFNDTIIKTQLFGRFNAANAIAAILAAQHHGVTEQHCLEALRTFNGVAGRMQSFKVSTGATAFVDYAHTDDALLNVGQALKELPHRKIITVFGCGGDRDRSKRPRMAKAAELISDQVIVTADNSRSEDILEIIKDIKEGFNQPEAPLFVPDRKLAIEKAVALSKSGDIILIAGKGHENYQIEHGKTIHFSDFETLSNL